ncbi:uncharacterized protein ASPGLDRAFT_33229 [Aspergillus glaucus CBS 516.65]|uniref:Uncharacterized protein n=1 Tax=Aspergillus glaucus CBS 516.65 TaxID=1160497 RepID=A0A1L9VQY7_ASPGL|nr:hypothetical protein ASPGLDRAFT_33229 [Aspergillus glaucus CBS 516.65]OJJ86312.1 hypothetical protein ASPGLDRAFT_33229 [Aspergillus glaucus CBS 516.65]
MTMRYTSDVPSREATVLRTTEEKVRSGCTPLEAHARWRQGTPLTPNPNWERRKPYIRPPWHTQPDTHIARGADEATALHHHVAKFPTA